MAFHLGQHKVIIYSVIVCSLKYLPQGLQISIHQLFQLFLSSLSAFVCLLEWMRSLDVIFLVRNEVQLRKERLLYSFSILLKNLCCSLVVWGEVSNDINKIIYHSALKVNNSQYTLICQFMHHQMTYLPSNSPLPPLSPLPAPLKVLSIFQKLQQQSSNSPKKIQIKVVSPKKQDYKSLYETKCEQLAKEMEKSRQFVSEIEQLRRENKELSIQIKRMQEDKWDKCNTFRQSQNRKRSKSIKKMTPTIEVKVPNDFQGPLSSGNRNNEEFTEYINLYRQQIELYKDEIKKLNEQVSLLRQKQQEPFDPFPESFSNPKRKEYQTHSPPTATQHHQNFDIKKHLVSDFSPSQPQSIDTIKKDKTFTQEVQFELKRLKNELLYKELLLDKLKQESIKENSVLQKHLKLSVKESKKVAETTAEIMNAFKKQMIQLWRQLEQEKNKNNRLEDQLRKQPSSASEVKSKWEPSGFDSDRSNLIALLQIRRTEKIQ